MKKNIFVVALSSLMLLNSCGNNSIKTTISITNKVSTFSLVEKNYALEIKKENVKDDDQLVFMTSDSDIATIDSEGCLSFLNTGNCKVTVILKSDSNIKDEFDFTVSNYAIRGTVTDKDGSPIADVNVSNNGQQTTTDDNGQYNLELKSDDGYVHYEKPGYESAAIDVKKHIRYNNESIINIKLLPIAFAHKITIKGTIKNANGDDLDKDRLCAFANGIKATFDDVKAKEIKYTIANVPISDKTVVEVFGTDNVAKESTEVEYIEGQTLYEDVDISLFKYQPAMKFFARENDGDTSGIYNKAVYANIYHTKVDDVDALRFELISNYEEGLDCMQTMAFYFNCGESSINDDGKNNKDFDLVFDRDSEDRWDIVFDMSKEYHSYRHGATPTSLSSGDAKIIKQEKKSLQFYVTKTLIGEAYNGTIGLASECLKLKEFGDYSMKCRIFSYNVTKKNQRSYARLSADDSAFAASNNNKPTEFEGLSFKNSTDAWKFVTVNDTIIEPVDKDDLAILGSIGNKFDHGYYLKIARKDNDSNDSLYFIYKRMNPDQNFYNLPTKWHPHIFIDAYQESNPDLYPAQPADADVVNRYKNNIHPFMLDVSYDMRSFTCSSMRRPLENTKIMSEDTAAFNGVSFYVNRDEAIIRINYSKLTYYDSVHNIDEQLTNNSVCGITINLNRHSWHGWSSANPSGYAAIPHIEELPSLFRFNINAMSMIKYKAPTLD